MVITLPLMRRTLAGQAQAATQPAPMLDMREPATEACRSQQSVTRMLPAGRGFESGLNDSQALHINSWRQVSQPGRKDHHTCQES